MTFRSRGQIVSFANTSVQVSLNPMHHTANMLQLLMCVRDYDMTVMMVSGSLQIRRSTESDEGKYECVAENSVGLAISYGANLYVRG